MSRHRPKQRLTDAQIRENAIRRAQDKKRFWTTVRGLTCSVCGSNKTKTEFYRFEGDRGPSFGVCACDSCGAC